MEFLVLLAIISKCLPLIPLLNELIMKDHFAIFDECLNIKEGQVRISNVKLCLFFELSIFKNIGNDKNINRSSLFKSTFRV